MRRLVVSVSVAFGLVLIGAGPALAEPAPEASAAQATAGKKVCKVTDERLDELSGIVATDDGFVVINDSTPLDSRKRVFFLNGDCAVVNTVSYSGNGPRDPEDLVLSADGKTLWIADIGDNDKQRPTIGLWSMPADGSEKPKIHRLAYPDGAHDAEAMLLNGDGTPIIVTKEVTRPAGLYTPTAALKTDNTEGVPLKKVGEITVPPSNTPSSALARLGKGTIDGGAVGSGGSKVVLRTYTDALEWSVSGGDVLAAIKGKPRVTPLPGEPQGEAITYSADGRYFYTVSDMQGNPNGLENYILRYTPVGVAATTKAAEGGGESDSSWFDKLTINDIRYIISGFGVLGAILVGLGIFGIMRARKQSPIAPVASKRAPDGQKPADAETELLAVGGVASGPGVYGRGPGGSTALGGRPGSPDGEVYGAGGVRPSRNGDQPSGAPGGRPVQSGQPAGRPVQSGQPGARPVQSGQPGGRPVQSGQPAGRPAQGDQPGGRPVQADQPGGGLPPVGRPGRGSGGGQPAGRPAGGGHAGRPDDGGQAGRPDGGGVYGAPLARSQEGPRRSGSGGQTPRPSGFVGPASGNQAAPPTAGRPTPNHSDSRGGDFGNPGYDRTPYGR